eukprot:TRINITY_DN356_c0_g1_i2.p1 TRINITY_DN356_c0_g1~~TRINITY_DN356_c0_g1_i2.p1  ORF type:complete len:152 (+),score=44.93 TRINITY_DN356_c0_g1_i2:215-670(+)
MVKDAEKFKQEDENARKKVESKNGLENYAYSMRNTLREEKIAAQISEGDKKTLNDAIDDAIRWLDSNQFAEAEEYESKQKELESKCTPVITKLYQGAGGMPEGGFGGPGSGFGGQGGGFGGQGGGFGGQGSPGGASGGSSGPSAPTVEEVD